MGIEILELLEYSAVFFGAAPAFGRVGLCRGSQVCSALQFFFASLQKTWVWPFGPPLSIPQPDLIALLWPSLL